jgi:acyl-coenzyme A thioesterase PaaI-like protein
MKPFANDVYVAEDCYGVKQNAVFAPIFLLYGGQVTYVARNKIQAIFTVDDRHLSRHGRTMHQGSNQFMCEEIAGMLSHVMVANLPTARVGTWVESHHLSHAYKGDCIRAEVDILKGGSRQQLFEVRVYAQSQSDNSANERLIGKCQRATFSTQPMTERKQNITATPSTATSSIANGKLSHSIHHPSALSSLSVSKHRSNM